MPSRVVQWADGSGSGLAGTPDERLPGERRDLPAQPLRPRTSPGHALLRFPSEIDFSNARDLLGVILAGVRTAARPRVLVLDLSTTLFMDSQGVRLINDVRRLLLPGTRVYVVARPDSVAGRVLELTGLRRDVPVYDNLPEALAA
ncbi:STAS domain-containing protein [Streptomyces sp. KM77-8]|uniref:STAS domain-containing protein n=1 Tax=Streptomyces haneummycinicus TaxID=3074435 RepID=A0AAT9I0E5_9ACTN